MGPRQEAASVFPALLHEGTKAEPPYTAFPQPKLNGAPQAPQNAGRKRANEQAKARQERNAVRIPFLNSAQPPLRYLRYIIAAEVAGAWQRLGGMGAPDGQIDAPDGGLGPHRHT